MERLLCLSEMPGRVRVWDEARRRRLVGAGEGECRRCTGRNQAGDGLVSLVIVRGVSTGM